MPITPLSTHQTEQQLFNQPEPQRSRPTYCSGDSIYNPEDYGWSYDEVFDIPAGKYFLGDPTFVLDELDVIAGSYEELETDGIGVVIRFFVPYAGGVYEDEEGHLHQCPCGSLGVVPIGHLTPGHWAALREVGRIVDFDDEFQVQLDSQGNLFLGWNWIFAGEEEPPEASRDYEG